MSDKIYIFKGGDIGSELKETIKELLYAISGKRLEDRLKNINKKVKTKEQDRLWNDLSEEKKVYYIGCYKKYHNNVEYHLNNDRLPQAMFNKGMIAILDEVFGSHNLNAQQAV